MTGAPTVQVLLDDGTGTFPLDVSSRLFGGTISSYGRSDEFATAQSAALRLTLDNTDGALSVGIDGFGVVPFGVGGFGLGSGAQVFKGQLAKVKVTMGATTRERFTGRVIGADLGWPGGSGGSGGSSELEVTALDLLTDISGVELRSFVEQEILLRAPSAAYYTLAEAEGATAAGDTSGNQTAVLAPAGAGAAVVFGVATGLTEQQTGVQLAGGKYLASTIGSAATYLVLAVFSRPAPPVTSEVLFTWGSETLVIQNDGRLVMWTRATPDSLLTGVYQSNTIVCDGLPHLVGMAIGPGMTSGFRIFADTEAAAFGTPPTLGNYAGNLTIGGPGQADILRTFVPLTGALSNIVAVTGVELSDFDVASISTALAGFVTDTTAQRLARLAAYGGVASTTTAGMSGQVMGPQAISGKTLLAALEEVAAAEGAPLYANGSGTVVLQGRGYRAGKTTPDLVLTSEEIAANSNITDDNQQQVTQVAVTRTGGAIQVVGAHTAGVEDKSLELVVEKDSDALQAAQWIVAKHSDPEPRIGSGDFDLYTSANAEQILQREIGDRISLTSLPAQAWAGSGDVTLEGWAEAFDDKSWNLAANLLPWSLATALVLDDPIYGALDTYPIAN